MTATALLLGTPRVMACAPDGNYQNFINSDCPTILSYDFTSNSPNFISSAINSAAITPNATTGVVTNPHNGSIASGAWVSSSASDTMSLSFSALQPIDLEAIQLRNYWSTEPTASSAWDYAVGKLFVNGVEVGSTGTGSFGFRGYKGNTSTGENSANYWEFAVGTTATLTTDTVAINAGDTVRIDLISGNGAHPTNEFVISKLRVTGCVTPEPSSVLFTAFAGLGFLVRRNRA